jgi:heat shock protein HslJ
VRVQRLSLAAVPAAGGEGSLDRRGRLDKMRFLLVVWILLGATADSHAQARPSADDQRKLVGRWMLVVFDLPTFSGPIDDVVIESNTISMKLNCNRIKLTYSAKDGELIATPITSTLVACDPRADNSFERAFYEALQNARYQVDDHVLRLSRADDPTSDWSFELRRID